MRLLFFFCRIPSYIYLWGVCMHAGASCLRNMIGFKEKKGERRKGDFAEWIHPCVCDIDSLPIMHRSGNLRRRLLLRLRARSRLHLWAACRCRSSAAAAAAAVAARTL